ncbi:MAG: AarF/UbiB family protein [Microthrixaceae bacterium]
MATIDDLDVGAALTEEHFETAPRVFPRELPATSRREVARRARQIGMVTAKHFAPLAARSALTRHLAPDAYARPLRKTFEELGATFMKFGQLIGSSPGMFGDNVAAEFRSCLDTGAPVPFDDVRRTVEADLGMPLDEAFWSFSETPIGRASISVVHKATTHDGRRSRGQGPASRHRAAGGPRPRPVPASARARGQADRRVRRRAASRRCSRGSGSRSARSWICATRPGPWPTTVGCSHGSTCRSSDGPRAVCPGAVAGPGC